MAHQFKVGDLAVVIGPKKSPWLNQVCTITGPLETAWGWSPLDHKTHVTTGYPTDLSTVKGEPGEHGRVVIHPDCLRPIRDGEQPSTWEAMKDIWLPNKLRSPVKCTETSTSTVESGATIHTSGCT